MNINVVKNCRRVGEIIISSTGYSGSSYVIHNNALDIIYDDKFPSELKNKHLSLVYIFTVNSIIYKIGQSSGKSGISGCLSFYFKSGQDDPGINRFTINWFIREEIKKKNKVEVYMVYMELVELEIPGLIRNKKLKVPISAKGMEEVFMEQYHELENKYPIWNYQENGKSLPNEISEAFGEYKTKRARGRNRD